VPCDWDLDITGVEPSDALLSEVAECDCSEESSVDSRENPGGSFGPDELLFFFLAIYIVYRYVYSEI
jgi:hypothetical protein